MAHDWWKVLVGILMLFSFPLGCIIVATIDELVMPHVRAHVIAYRRRRRAQKRAAQ